MAKRDSAPFGKRDRKTDSIRGLVLVAMMLMLILLEMTVGSYFERQQMRDIVSANRNAAISYYVLPDRYKSVSENTGQRKRLLYISNSHAKTGGQIPVHLQGLLNRLAPGEFEVLDMSDPGIFAPDILQRTLAGLDLAPEVIILGVSYICFSDRMGLARQSHSARSFFKNGIIEKLSAGFWLRNYDLGLYAETLTAHDLKLYRYRNGIRDTWEQPAADLIRNISGVQRVLFLQADVNQSWKFPEGYDKNLFQWNLYAAGREGHLADLREAITATRRNDVPVLALNMPIHWEKSIYAHDPEDAKEYRIDLQDVFVDVMEYVDYQDSFPKRFSTYDALHPTWHGARLHALDISLRLARHGFFSRRMSPKQIVESYLDMDPSLIEEYLNSLDGNHSSPIRTPFRRYDISEPENAKDLMQRLVSLPTGSTREKRLLHDLSLRLRYWLEERFMTEDGDTEAYISEAFRYAVRHEIPKARERIRIFWKELVENQTRRLAASPVPEPQEMTMMQRRVKQINQDVTLVFSQYQNSNETTLIKVTTEEGRMVAFSVSDPANDLAYQRTDILGDGSFLVLQPLEEAIQLPSWLMHSSPFVQFGI